MTSRFVTAFASGLMFAATAAGLSTLSISAAQAQTSLGWGQHVPPYGNGYIGNVPNTTAATSYYRAPMVGYGGAYAPAPVTAYGGAYAQPNTAFYAPRSVPAVNMPQGNYAPNVNYRVGTPNAAAYTTAYSPIVTPTTPYNANWQYPPQTVMPTVANYAPAPYYANYANYAAPAPPYYTTNYARTPVTTYRPVTVLSPAGVQQTVLQPCTGYECQAQRRHCGFFGWLFHKHLQPATVALPPPQVTIGQPVLSNYAAAPCSNNVAAPCSSNACPQPATVGQPYYTPGPAPIGTGAINIPANQIPSLSAPPPSYPSSTTIPPPSGVAPIGTAPPIGIAPSNGFNSGAARADYPPVADPYAPYPATRIPLAVEVPPAPAAPLAPLEPYPELDHEPADESPALNGPANAPIGSGVTEPAPVDGGARSPVRPSYNVETRQRPQAVIRRDSNITPIPDPEYRDRTPAKVNKAPLLISPRNRTAQAPSSDARLASYDEAVPVVAPKPAILTKPAVRKVLGDDIWQTKK